MSDPIITIGDLKLIMGIISVGTQRGIFSAEDLTRIGGLYDKMHAITSSVEKQAKEAAENEEAQNEEAENEKTA